jgi:glycogen debranching enzyme
VNQGWKDSWDAISFDDGRLAEPPIALAEVQAYAYAAWRSGAQLAAAAGDYVLAAARAKRAARLQYAFDDAFWLPDRGYYAMALDGSKRPADALASNLGHLLWCGIVPEHRVPLVAAALASDELFSNWGVRTLGRSCARYDPLGYHTGSVWPHDTAIAVMGLRRAGREAEAARIACGLLAAARANGGRLPELFAGIGPADFPVPVPYPASCSPQAWASAAPLLIVRALLGLEADVPNGRITLQPALPATTPRLLVDGIRIAQSDASIDVEGDAVAIRNLPAGVSVIRRG